MTKKPIVSNQSAPPVGPYSPAVLVNDWLYVSGQIPLLPDGALVSGDMVAEVRQVLTNIEAVLTAANAQWNHVVKVNIYTTDLSQFDTINDVYAEFVQPPFPARAAVEVAALPKGVRIEMEAIAYVK